MGYDTLGCCSSSRLCRLSLNSPGGRDSVADAISPSNIGDEHLTPYREAYSKRETCHTNGGSPALKNDEKSKNHTQRLQTIYTISTKKYSKKKQKKSTYKTYKKTYKYTQTTKKLHTKITT